MLLYVCVQEASDYGLVQMVRLSIKIGGAGQVGINNGCCQAQKPTVLPIGLLNTLTSVQDAWAGAGNAAQYQDKPAHRMCVCCCCLSCTADCVWCAAP